MSAPRWESPVKRKLREGKPVLAATITVNSIDVAAHMATLGFDFLWIEMEHSPITLETLRNMVLATRGLAALPFARVPVNELWTAKRVLDAGVYGVMFPFTSTPELAQQAAAACHYPPLGRRGSGPTLARFGWTDGDRYHDSADENVTVIVIIEEARAVERIDEIAATPGVDVMFIGTSDLSFSLGLRGDQNHPKAARSHRQDRGCGQTARQGSGTSRGHSGAGQGIHAAGISVVPGAHRNRIDDRRRAQVSGSAQRIGCCRSRSTAR
jgi:2-keto-3-deoxy-L-rhamnonate aldolase RhmA